MADLLGKLEEAKQTGLLHLVQLNLRAVPSDLFRLNFSALYRLDLGFNHVRVLPDAIGQLAALEFLWLNDNPLQSIPPSIHKCVKLQVLDLNRTELRDLPCELGRMQHLIVLDLDRVPLAAKLLAATQVVGKSEKQAQAVCASVLRYLHRKDVRRQQKQILFEKLKDGPYRESADTNDGMERIHRLMKRAIKEFPTEDDVQSLIRNLERLFPPNLITASDHPSATATAMRAHFVQLKQDNQKKKLAAELELKIRNIYFDRIDPVAVEPMVLSIYTEIKSLKDIKFLIRYATSLFPPTAAEVDGAELRDRLAALQDEMARERQNAIDKVFVAVTGIYSDVEPDKIRALIDQVVPLFKNVKDLKTLAADAALHFPSEFLNAVAADIKQSFVRKAHGAADMDKTLSMTKT
ncbi:hypothetical protein SDRG_00012 [Saprolegnia diclina VS20]|uniref:Uncharacterized protein n=1 Tax=Saprolegnia diclina (strain VS20) TaxID=1156394 RepID=T0SH23_SAPDV|nr:hypothetical protein SDRG_00012 [Saprolegnia diclina VS20]EQC42272.1 hypothetical protein SDRG_00012 [Saprolegnia diclina VS20]|eukprot:XP_008603695.1 hypothetical protein SDRG_00012 [Saprolegnia diclina VS20]